MAQYPSMLDMANAMDPDGSVAAVAEVLNQTNEAMADWSFMEGNLPTGHRSTIRTGIPNGTWRRLYQGVQPTKSTRAQVTDTTGMLEAYNQIDVREANLNGNSKEFRLSEATAQIEGMGQDLVETLFYGNTTINPERFDGFAVRYNDKAAANGENIVDAGGTGSDNRSIWLVVWGDMTCHGIVPKGSTSGIQINDKGQDTVRNADGSQYEAYVTHFAVDAGLVLKDWRYVVRIANIDFSALSADVASGGANLASLMFEAIERIPNLSRGNAVFYMARAVLTKFRQQLASGTKNSTLEYQNIGGHRTATWNDIPLRRVDRLAVDEAQVT
ncbi:MAG: major capsid protein [Granulosicoccaceae bacterium]